MRLIAKTLRSVTSRGLVETIKIIYYDLLFSIKYKMKFKESVPLDKLEISSSNRDFGVTYQRSSYYYVKLAFKNLPINFKESSLIDFGSGKGDIIIMTHRLGFKNILGIEFARELVNASENYIRHRIEKNTKTELKVLYCDAATYEIPGNYNVFFFYNPFNRFIFEKVLENIDLSLKKNNRKIYIIYINAVISEELFYQFNYKLIYKHKSKKKLEILIFSK